MHSNSIYGPYFMCVISLVSALRVLRAHSIIYFHEIGGGGLIERGGYLQLLLVRGA